MEKLFRSKTTAQRDAPQRVKDKKMHSPCPSLRERPVVVTKHP